MPSQNRKNPGISSFPHKDQELMKGRDMDWRIPHTKLILGWNKCLKKGKKEIKLHQRKADHKENSKPALVFGDVK